LFLGIYLPLHLYGGIGPMFEKIAAAKPGFLIFPASGQSVAWFISTVLLTAIGFLHVAALLRRLLRCERRACIPTQCDRLADLPAYTAVRVLRRLGRGAAS